MRVDLLLDTFGTRWSELRAAAVEAEQAGFDGVWLNDHLAGSVEGASDVLECWTALSALAEAVPRIAVGSLVLNVANRDPGTLAVMAATLQEVSGGRLLLGLGAGARRGTSFALEQEALGRPTPSDPERRRTLVHTITMLQRVWSGAVPPAAGFLRPAPVPPIVVAAFGPKMAEIAGRTADGICVPLGSTTVDLVAGARRARAGSGRDPLGLLVVATLPSGLGPSRAATVDGLDRLILYAARPFDETVRRAAHLLRRAGNADEHEAANE